MFDFCIGILINAYLKKCLKCCASRCFQPEEGPSRGLLRECETLRRFVSSSNAQCSAQLCSDQIISNYRGQGQQPAQAVASEELPAALIPNFLARVLLSFLINHPGFYKYLIPGSLDYELFTMPTPKPITN